MRFKLGRSAFLRAAGIVALAWAGGTSAASVELVGTADLVRESQFIFHGTVESRSVARAGRRDAIVTRVIFRIEEVLKGAPDRETVELEFAGGTLDGLTLTVSDMTIPAVGEEGIYFVEQLDQPQANPIYGWHQGYFMVRHDEFGRKIVTTFDLAPVYDLQAESARTAPDLASGRAKGVVTEATNRTRSPLSLAEFKRSLRRLVEVLQ